MPTKSELPELGRGADALAELLGKSIDIKQAQKLKENQMRLEDVLKKKRSQEEFESAQQAVQDAAKKGMKVNAKIGEASYSQAEPDYSKNALAQQKGEDAVLAKSNAIYQKGYNDLNKKLDAIEEGKASLSRGDISTLGQARAAALRVAGLNRFNAEEAKNLLPPTLYSRLVGTWNSLTGDDAQSLGENQRKAMSDLFNTANEHAAAAHEKHLNNALGFYRTSAYYNPQKEELIHQTWGQPFRERTKEINDMPVSRPDQTTQEQHPGMFSGLFNFLKQTPTQPSSTKTREQKIQELRALGHK